MYRRKKSFTLIEILVVIALLGIITSISTNFFSSYATIAEYRSQAYDIVSRIDKVRSGALYGKTGTRGRGWSGLVFNANTNTTNGVYESESPDDSELILLNKDTRLEKIKEIKAPIAFCFVSRNSIKNIPTCPAGSRFISDISFPQNTKIGVHFRQPDTHPAFVYHEGDIKKVVIYSQVRNAEDECTDDSKKVDCLDIESVDISGIQIFIGDPGTESSLIINLLGFAYVI